MNNEDKILAILETLVIKVDKLEQGQIKLEQEIAEIKADVKSIRKELKYIWEDLNITVDQVHKFKESV